MKSIISRFLLPLALLCAAACLSADQPPGGPGGDGPRPPRNREFRVHLLPPEAAEQLALTADQAKAIAALEKKTQAALEAILTADQKQRLRRLGAGGPMAPGTENPPPPLR